MGINICDDKKNKYFNFYLFNSYFSLEISENIKEIFIRYPKYKELKIAISDNNNLGEITLLKRGCKK